MFCLFCFASILQPPCFCIVFYRINPTITTLTSSIVFLFKLYLQFYMNLYVFFLKKAKKYKYILLSIQQQYQQHENKNEKKREINRIFFLISFCLFVRFLFFCFFFRFGKLIMLCVLLNCIYYVCICVCVWVSVCVYVSMYERLSNICELSNGFSWGFGWCYMFFYFSIVVRLAAIKTVCLAQNNWVIGNIYFLRPWIKDGGIHNASYPDCYLFFFVITTSHTILMFKISICGRGFFSMIDTYSGYFLGMPST